MGATWLEIDPWTEIQPALMRGEEVEVRVELTDGNPLQGVVTGVGDEWVRLRGSSGAEAWVNKRAIVTWRLQRAVEP